MKPKSRRRLPSDALLLLREINAKVDQLLNRPSDWMSRGEAAEYLRVSVRQLTRLNLPRTRVGKKGGRYSRDAINEFLAASTYTPPPKAGRAARQAAPHIATKPTDPVKWLAQLKRDLHKPRGR